MEIVKKELESKLKDSSQEIRVGDLSEDADGTKETLKRNIVNAKIMAGVLILLASIGLIGC